MAGETTAATAAPAAPAQTPAPQPQGQQPAHHSARQPRDEGQRFAGPPGQQPQPSDGQQPPTTQAKRRFTFVEEGKEVVEELTDAEIEQRVRAERNRRYLDKTATQKLQRAGEIVKKAQTAEQVAQALVNKDPDALEAYFEKSGQDPADALGDVLEAILKKREMTPEQKELAALRAEKAALEEEKRRDKEEANVRAFQERMDRIRPEVEKVWTHALTQEHLPQTEAMLERSAEIFLTALEAGQRLSPEQVAELTRWELVDSQRQLVESLEPTHLFQHFPGAMQKLDEGLTPEEFKQRFPQLAKRYHKYLADQVRGTARRGAQPAPTGTARPAPRSQEEGVEAVDPYFVNKLRARQG